ncbi:general L-amino acid transport system permease protein [Amphibacillus marinus]|uniref:General L-amino acid transport system permease protein n=1 Tax=Amphibacillus marinus TaxID=872970 RepID=A0A1H8IFN9_9BACI|nr:ABC transporter permease subunit [Amphibacillus marinus]SEN66518.1 general L-amino acid transport system permease protein [Amphibacillus marinus]
MSKSQQVKTPFWRDDRILPIIFQVVFVVIVVLFFGFLINNAINGLSRLGINFGFNFLRRTASFNISESLISYDASDIYGRAIIVGMLNTLRIAIIGVILATILGVLVGIGRLSKNWLVRKLSGMYIEIFRNTPLLVQIFIWYFAVILPLPQVQESFAIGNFYFNNRGIAIPWFLSNDGTLIWLVLFIVGLAGAFFTWRFQLNQQVKKGKRTFPFIWALAALLTSWLLAFLVTQSGPFNISIPELGNFNFSGGLRVSAEFLAILTGLVIYTATFIAEIVRAGIQSVNKGQTEAAQAIGLKSSTMMRLVILPQAIRIIIPPITSQYLNLTKNSSLAIAVGYQELVAVGNTTINQSGHAVEVFLIIICVYLALNLTTSLFMNIFNRKTQLVER